MNKDTRRKSHWHSRKKIYTFREKIRMNKDTIRKSFWHLRKKFILYQN